MTSKSSQEAFYIFDAIAIKTKEMRVKSVSGIQEIIEIQNIALMDGKVWQQMGLLDQFTFLIGCNLMEC